MVAIRFGGVTAYAPIARWLPFLEKPIKTTQFIVKDSTFNVAMLERGQRDLVIQLTLIHIRMRSIPK